MKGRCLAVSILALVACSEPRGPGGDAALGAMTTSGPDPIVLRIARGGGAVRAYRYPRLDSLLWSSAQPSGPPARILAFDQENGVVAFTDQGGSAGWIDLRLGSVTTMPKAKLTQVVSTDAWSIYGVARDTGVRRLTPSGEWSWTAHGHVLGLHPQPNGELILMTGNAATARLLRLRPPEATPGDSTTLPTPDFTIDAPLGDRFYAARGDQLTILDATTLREVDRIGFSADIVDLATTPSGDRVYIATRGSRDVQVLDRYAGSRQAPIRLPRAARALRMDPLGRLLLARADSGDSAWVISVANGRLVASVPTGWRADLPTVASDGSVVTVVGNDVRFTAPGQAKPRILVREGGGEFWYFLFWNGFRPRAKSLDQPVVFQEDTTTYGFRAPPQETAPPPASREDSVSARPTVPTRDTAASRPAARTEGWMVSFAAMLSEERARSIAQEIRVNGQQARVVVSETEGARVYRVVLGPFPTRPDADRVGRASGRSYFVFEATP